MAIDTAAKRFSMMSFGKPFLRLVPPDGSIDQGDRQTYAGLYGGVLAAASAYIVGELHMAFGAPLQPGIAAGTPLTPGTTFGTPLAPSITIGD